MFTGSPGSTWAGGSESQATWERFSRPPLDSVQARDTRIWFGLAHQGGCRIRIEVLDTSQKIVRHLSDQLMTSGYYNLYWDKKDDSARFVPKGLYYYRIGSGCAPEMKRKLWAGYRPFERVVRLAVDTADREAAATIMVDTPAVRLSLDVYTQYGVLVDSLCPDTVLSTGQHRFVWTPQYGTALGEYWVRMKAESFITEEKIRLR
jgi:flagellar hook assembly protein FlgD